MSVLKLLFSSSRPPNPQEAIEIFEAYRVDLYPFLLKRVGPEADDLLSEIRMEFHRRLDSLRNPDQLKSFLFQVAKDTLKKHWLQQQRCLGIPDHLDVTAPNANQETQLLTKERIQVLQDCIKALGSLKLRGVAQLRYAKNVPHAQIRQELDLTPDQVKKMIKKAEIAITDCVRSRFQN